VSAYGRVGVWLVGTRSRAIRRSTPMSKSGAAPQTVVALRRVRRRTANERAKMNQVKTIERAAAPESA